MERKNKDGVIMGLGAYALVFQFIAVLILNQEGTGNYLLLNIGNGIGMLMFFALLSFYQNRPEKDERK